jgi:hypothetical protein
MKESINPEKRLAVDEEVKNFNDHVGKYDQDDEYDNLIDFADSLANILGIGLEDEEKLDSLLKFVSDFTHGNSTDVTYEGIIQVIGETIGEAVSFDDKVIEEIARRWIELGGDAEGILWNWEKIRDKVEELEKKDDEAEG